MIKLLPWLPHFWGWQMTQPLLFDDCLSILQKILLLARKLNELIEDYNKFKEDFFAWKAEVDAAIAELREAVNELDDRVSRLEECCAEVQNDIAELKNRVSATESAISNLETTINEYGDDISELQTNVTNLSNTVNNLGDDLTDVTNRISTLENNYSNIVTSITNLQNQATTQAQEITALQNRVSTLETKVAAIENALARLDIQLPIELINNNNFSALADSWYDWIANFCDTYGNATTGNFKSIWQLTDDITPGIVVPHPIPDKSLTVGKLGQNLVLAKIPLFLKKALTAPTTLANESNVITEVLNAISSSHLDILFKRGLWSDNAFFDVAIAEPYPYIIDEIKFQTSYMYFNYGGALPTDLNKMYRVSFPMPTGNPTVESATCINMDVRLQITKNANTAKMQVLSNEIFFVVYNGFVTVAFIAENA